MIQLRFYLAGHIFIGILAKKIMNHAKVALVPIRIVIPFRNEMLRGALNNIGLRSAKRFIMMFAPLSFCNMLLIVRDK